MSDERIIEYLRGRARVEVPFDTVASVMAAIDAAPAARRSWFAIPVPVAAGAAAVVAAVVVAIVFLGSPRVTSPGPVPDCESDPAGLLAYARALLDESPGYRWTETEEMWGFDPAFPVSASDPHYAYSGYTAEGAYRAPDRMHVVTVEENTSLELVGVAGFPELIVIGSHGYGYNPGQLDPEGNDVPDWQEIPAEFHANRIAEALPFEGRIPTGPASPDDVSTDPVDLTWDVPGEGGCVVWWTLDLSPDLPPSEIAVRIDDEGRVLAGVYDGTHPEAPDEERMATNDLRWRFSVVYDVPDASEVQPPEGPIYSYDATAP
jgi:hypothetical protein